MGRRHLQELLSEDQEPFVLKTFIDERKSQLQRRSNAANGRMQFSIRLPTPQNHAFSPSHYCRSSPFLPFLDCSESKRSPLRPFPEGRRAAPLVDFGGKSPSSASKMTSTLLLEAALRIQRHQHRHHSQQKQQKTKKKKRRKDKVSNGLGFGFLFSLLKRLALNKPQKEIKDEEQSTVSVKDILKWDSPIAERNHGAQASDAKHMPFQRKKGLRIAVADNPLGSEYGNCGRGNCVLQQCGFPKPPEDEDLFSSTSSPRRSFMASSTSSSSSSSLSQFSSDYHRVMVFRSPEASPNRRRKEAQLFAGAVDDGASIGGGSSVLYCEEEKDQFSPVSVLDPPFEEEEEGEDHHRPGPALLLDQHHHQLQHHRSDLVEEEAEQATLEVAGEAPVGHVGCRFQQSLANVQRSRKNLLGQIRRFERLAGLDPVDLEQRLASTEDDEGDEEEGEHDSNWSDNNDDAHGYEKSAEEPSAAFEIDDLCEFITDEFSGGCSSVSRREWKIPSDLRALILDLLEEEKYRASDPQGGVLDIDRAASEVKNRFEDWKGVEAHTIDMMVDSDMRRDSEEWKSAKQELSDVTAAVEVGILSFLVEELSEELAFHIKP